MKKNILLINGKKEFGHSKGALNQYMNDLAESELKNIGHNVQVTVVDDGYDIETEIEKMAMGRCCYISNARLVDGTTLDY